MQAPANHGKHVALPNFETALMFVEISPQENVDDGTPAWWPCVVCSNMEQLSAVVRQLDVCWSDFDEKKSWTMDFIQHLKDSPKTATTDSVALLLGKNTPNGRRCVYWKDDDAPHLEDFYAVFVQLSTQYCHHEDFMAAVQEAPRFISRGNEQQAVNSTAASENNDSIAAAAAASTKDAPTSAANKEAASSPEEQQQQIMEEPTSKPPSPSSSLNVTSDMSTKKPQQAEIMAKAPSQESNNTDNLVSTMAAGSPHEAEEEPSCAEKSVSKDRPNDQLSQTTAASNEATSAEAEAMDVDSTLEKSVSKNPPNDSQSHTAASNEAPSTETEAMDVDLAPVVATEKIQDKQSDAAASPADKSTTTEHPLSGKSDSAVNGTATQHQACAASSDGSVPMEFETTSKGPSEKNGNETIEQPQEETQASTATTEMPRPGANETKHQATIASSNESEPMEDEPTQEHGAEKSSSSEEATSESPSETAATATSSKESDAVVNEHETPLKRNTRASLKASSGSGRKKKTPKRKQEPKSAAKTSSTNKKQKSSSSKKKVEPNYYELTVPTFAKVKPVLQKGGYTFARNSRYCRPVENTETAVEGSDIFSREDVFRRHLCEYGVTCKCGSTANEETECECWSEDDKWLIHEWVRYSVMKQVPPPDTNVAKIEQKEAKELLLRIGFQNDNSAGGVAFPGVEKYDPGVSFFHMENDLWDNLCRQGFPKGCNFDQLSAEEKLSLEFCVSSNPRINSFKPVQRSMGHTVGVSPQGRRRLRSRRLSMDQTPGDSATVISMDSSVAPATVTRKKRGGSKDTSKKKQKTSRMQRDMPIQPNPSALATSPLPRPANRNVSLSPLLKGDNAVLPEFHGTEQEKLHACLDTLKSSHKTDRPTFSSTDSNSKFTANLQVVFDFLKASIESNGEHGGYPGEPSALFVCGAPGIGKTSGVKWCSEEAVNTWKSQGSVTTAVCHINAGHLISEPDPWKCVMGELRVSLGIKTPTPKLSTIEQRLKRHEDDPKGYFLVVVIDEVDALVSSDSTSDAENCNRREKCLQTLLEWAKDSDKQMAFIGISNCANDEKAARIQELGTFKETVAFSAYSENEIFGILEARVGRSVVKENVLSFIAKKVATASGDIRQAFEMLANAVQHRIQHPGKSDSNETQLVSMTNAVSGNKEESIAKKIDGLPLTGKILLCVLTTLCQGGHTKATVGELKTCVTDCMKQSGSTDEILQLDDFLPLLETLVEMGLLRASVDANRSDSFSLSDLDLSDLLGEELHLGKPLDEIEKALEKELNQAYFRDLREQASKQKDMMQE